eukprot:9050780-Pyramimonas_sp.AAC.1
MRRTPGTESALDDHAREASRPGVAAARRAAERPSSSSSFSLCAASFSPPPFGPSPLPSSPFPRARKPAGPPVWNAAQRSCAAGVTITVVAQSAHSAPHSCRSQRRGPAPPATAAEGSHGASLRTTGEGGDRARGKGEEHAQII